MLVALLFQRTYGGGGWRCEAWRLLDDRSELVGTSGELRHSPESAFANATARLEDGFQAWFCSGPAPVGAFSLGREAFLFHMPAVGRTPGGLPGALLRNRR